MSEARVNPFPGLRSFEPDEEHLFFGRERQIDELLTRLRLTRFLTVVGASGSGKSSLVRSGLIPSMYAGYMVGAGSSWRIAILRPGEDPIGNLASSLSAEEVLAAGGAPREMLRGIYDATLRRGSRGLLDVVREARLPAEENLLIVVDQFEELFRFKRSRKRRGSADEAAAFVKLLLTASRDERLPVYVALTMRSDFLGNCTEFEELPDAINEGLYLIPRMTREQRRTAIEGPIAVGGAAISPRLVLRILNDVGDDPDQLPIMQHALMRTWDLWARDHVDGEPLDLRHYEAVGTLSEAMSQHAEEAYLELESEGLAAVAERMFKSLTEKGQDGKGIRRPLSLEQLAAETGVDIDDLRRVAETFRRPGRSFLMPPAGVPLAESSILDISHESLMRVWTRLSRWVDEESQSSQLYTRLARAAALYQEGKAGLWRDPELQVALGWQELRRPTQDWARRYDPSFERAIGFLELSHEERDREASRRERARQAQLRRTRIFAAILGGAAFLTLLAGIYAFMLKERAEEERLAAVAAREAEVSARLDADSARQEAELERDRTSQEKERAEAAATEALAQREAAEAQRLEAESERLRAERQTLLADRERERAEGASVEAEQQRQQALIARDTAVTARQEAQLSEGRANRLRLLELARALAGQVPKLGAETGPDVAGLAALEAYRLNRDQGGPDEVPEIHQALSEALAALGDEPHPTLTGHGDGVRALALAPVAGWLASGGEDGRVLRFAAIGGAASRPLAELGEPVRGLAVTPDGDRLAVVTLSGAVTLLEANREERPSGARPLGAVPEPARALALSADGRRLAVAGAAGITLWPLAADGAPTGAGLGVEGGEGARALAFHPSGEVLAAALEAGEVRLWRLSGEGAGLRTERAESLAAPPSPRSLAFDASGRRLAAGARDGTVRVWDLETGGGAPAATLVGHRSAVNGLAFEPSSGALVSGSSDSTVRIWRLAEPDAPPLVLAGHESWVWQVAAAPGGERVYSASADGKVVAWIARSAVLAERVCPRVGRALTRQEWGAIFPDDLAYEPACRHGAAP